MQQVLLLAAGLVAIGAPTYFLLRLILAARAIKLARTAMEELEAELHAASTGGARKYEVPLPNREEFDLERSVCADLLPYFEKNLMALANEPLGTMLTRAWVARCNEFARKARKMVRRLQEEAFWAQMPPGTEMSECRFRKDEDLEE